MLIRARLGLLNPFQQSACLKTKPQNKNNPLAYYLKFKFSSTELKRTFHLMHYSCHVQHCTTHITVVMFWRISVFGIFRRMFWFRTLDQEYLRACSTILMFLRSKPEHSAKHTKKTNSSEHDNCYVCCILQFSCSTWQLFFYMTTVYM